MNNLVIADSKKLPAHVLAASGKGNENIDTTMVTIPRIKLLQDMSPEVKKSSDRRVEGAEPGMLMLSSGGEVFNELYVLNLKVRSGYVAFSEESKMPFRAMVTGDDGDDGMFSSIDSALKALDFAGVEREKIETEPGKQGPKDGYTVLESHRHYILVVDPETGKIKTPANMDFIKTKVAISKQWNTIIATQAGDRYSSVYRIGSKVQSWNENSWYNYDISWHGYATEALYGEADKIFAAL